MQLSVWHFSITVTKAVGNPCFAEVFSGISKAAGWQWDLGEPVEGGFVTMWGWFRHLKMICKTSISKYAVAQPSKHLQEPVTVTQACIQHTYTHTTVTHRCADTTLLRTGSCKMFCATVYFWTQWFVFPSKWQIRIVFCALNLAKWLFFLESWM